MEQYRFSIPLKVRVNDLNYGNHVAYQNFFSYFQEARLAYLNQFGYSELDIEGLGMIVGEANCKYKREIFLNDPIRVACGVSEVRSKLFIMEYRILNEENTCAEGFTRNFCYDYQKKKVVRLPNVFVDTVRMFEEGRQ